MICFSSKLRTLSLRVVTFVPKTTGRTKREYIKIMPISAHLLPNSHMMSWGVHRQRFFWLQRIPDLESSNGEVAQWLRRLTANQSQG